MYISYAKGARTWERHIDIPYPEGHEQKEVSNYCSLPHQIDEWFKAFNKATIMCGTATNVRRVVDEKESNYLQALYRGLYINQDLKKGTKITLDHLYSAIPYQKEINHITSREYFDSDFILNKDISKDSPLTKQDII
jgi:N-acetylneuraminate synthase